ncbi:hypothetical protein ACOMHN_065685 [Nucella lapillus]
MSSPVLNLFIAGGGILLSVCTTLYGMDYFLADFTGVSSAVCKSRVGLLACGFSLMLGPMFLKSWRVYRLFQNAGRKRVIIRDSRLLLMTGGLLLLDVALLLIWPLTLCSFGQCPYFDRRRLELQCPAADHSDLQLHQPFLAHMARHFPRLQDGAAVLRPLPVLAHTRSALPAMNDSQCIVVSSLTTVTMATLTLSVSHVLPEYPNVVYACVVFSIWLCMVMTLCMAFVPKVSLWWRNPEAKDLRVSVTSAGISSSPLFPLLHLEEELGQVVAENEALRKSLEEKDSSIRQLQQHLTNAYRHLSHLGLNLGLIQDSRQDADFSSSDSENPQTFPNKPASSVHGSDGKSCRRKRRHRRRHSANSITSGDKLSELRAAIALDLQRARSLSNVLSNSVSKELDNVYRRHSRQLRRRSSSIKSREELAESIVGSYGLEDNTDTLSYVSSYLPLPSLQDRNQDLVTSRREFSVLDSDAFYPERRHKDSVTSLSRKKWSDAPSSSVVDRSIKIGDRGKGRDIISYQRSCPQTDREERDTKYLAGQNKNKGQTLTSCGKNVNSNTYNAASLGDGGDDRSRSEPRLQERGVGQQEVFSVYSARPAHFVQKGYAHTRPLYSVDTFI